MIIWTTQIPLWALLLGSAPLFFSTGARARGRHA